jgi:hypothetical protein
MDKEVDGQGRYGQVSMSIAACGSTPGMHMEPAGWFAVDAAAALGGEMSKLGEQLHLNDTQVREAERRLGHQHTFIARLHASSRDTTSAQESLEVIRDILRGLYQERSQLRRRIARGK